MAEHLDTGKCPVESFLMQNRPMINNIACIKSFEKLNIAIRECIQFTEIPDHDLIENKLGQKGKWKHYNLQFRVWRNSLLETL